MTLENIEIIYEWDLSELWAYINVYEDELDNEQQQSLNTIKFGYDEELQMHINHLANNHYTEYPEYDLALVCKRKVPINKLWDEIQRRKQEIRKLIIQLNIKEEPYSPR